MNRIKFYTDLTEWVIPASIHLSLVGNNHRLYTVSIDILCFRLIFCIDDDSY